MLLDCWTIPCAILLTWIFLKTKYGLRKFIGVGVCVVGLILVVFSDVHASDRASKDILYFIKLLLFHIYISGSYVIN
jgi:drug/metabolite transporter (DMT)-like permease